MSTATFPSGSKNQCAAGTEQPAELAVAEVKAHLETADLVLLE